MKDVSKTKSLTDSLVTDGIGTDILQGSALGIGAMIVGLIGAWAVSSLVAGLVTAGGPLELVSSWFKAVSGG